MINIEVGKVQRIGSQTLLGVIFSCPGTVEIQEVIITAKFFTDGRNYITPDPQSVIPEQDAYGNYVVNVAVNELWSEAYTDFGLYQVEVHWQNEDEDPKTDIFFISDVEFAYHCITSQLLSMGDCCADIPEGVIRAYLLLFGHHQAMQYKDFPKAEYFYQKLIQLCKGRCYTPNPCNCK